MFDVIKRVIVCEVLWAYPDLKSYFAAHKLDYLGFHVTCDGVMSIPKKFEAIQALAVSKNRKQLRQFIGMINFYRDM